MNASVHPLLLEVEGLSVSFGDTGKDKVLDDVSFSLRRGEIVGIVGETGAGKSVLARAIIDMLPEGGRVEAGAIKVEGRDVLKLNEQERHGYRGGDVALIGTNAKMLLDPVETVGAQVVRVLRAHKRMSKKQAWAEAIELFKQVGIVNPEARAHAYPHEMSGGMAQRVVIAMALVAQPKILLADDATLGLDATIQLQVLDLMVQKGKDLGLGVLLITHDLGIVANYCDRVAIIKGGKLIELAEVGQFVKAPAKEYSRELLDAAKVRPSTLRREAHTSAPITVKPPLLEVENLVKTFKSDRSHAVVKAIDNVSFKIAKGETLALVGESGSGKTTTGLCLLRLLESDAGTIRFDGQSTREMSNSEFRTVRRRMQMVFQEPYVSLNPRWRTDDLVAEPFGLLPRMTKADRRKRVLELLQLVGVSTRKVGCYPHELTAGEQKRVGIARALAANPDFIVFDECTTALDIRVRAQIIDLVRNLQAEMGLSALFITHDLNSVRSLAHFVAVMQHGKIVETGETEQIFASPVQAYTKKLLQAELPIECEARAAHQLDIVGVKQ
ncbi:ABC transporter ATP-binding protein [Burkholderia multivorans]|uniref:ATP-binding cassette domain-containing protein n=1 Tax=Burkholderia multivorans TaxID=87883 RepID=UPI000D00A059|nr:ABC transporter ATP-binding protein [Burkholderia multivorans]MDN7954001.1 ABC transporter ATP-binding protein [Burkholderia multivorans]PRG67557.1 ABC transporter ATP-binding protein [Burkholderia multivorans]